MTLLDRLRAGSTSPLNDELMRSAADDLEAGGIVATVFDGLGGLPPAAVPELRFVAAVHRLVLSRHAPRLALLYPSVGGVLNRAQLWPAAAEALGENTTQVRRWMAETGVQTNEVGRCGPLWGGLQVAAQRCGKLPVRLLEVGASAGLNLRPDRIGLVVGGRVRGQTDSGLVLDPGWTGLPSVDLERPLRISHRAACDLQPVDVSTTDGREHLASFVWADDLARWERLRAAMTLAQAEPVAVQPLSAADFLGAELAHAHLGELTVVWHSVVWQYVSAAERERARAVLAAAATRASIHAPLALLTYEPVRAEPGASQAYRFELRLRVWPTGSGTELLGVGAGHGSPFHWG
ncbi:MAG: DUF2332 domain-containing protein [Mycobacteriaceae bacterium]